MRLSFGHPTDEVCYVGNNSGSFNPMPRRGDNPQERRNYYHNPPVQDPSRDRGPIPMEIGAVHKKFSPLTPEERKRRVDNKLCLYCGQPGHLAGSCPAKVDKNPSSKKPKAQY
jgi:hypothetical protein